MKITCVRCDNHFEEDEIKYAFEEPYCCDCFDEKFTYCSRCDVILYNDDARYNDDGYAYCDECYNEEDDPDCPDNPDVDEVDRVHIINLSRNWLKGEIETKRSIYINNKDYLLKTIREKVGLVEDPIYVFGLKDRDEHQITASPNLFGDVKEIIPLHLPGVIVYEGYGINRLGISYSLRKNNSKEVIGLIKSLTAVKEPVPA